MGDRIPFVWPITAVLLFAAACTSPRSSAPPSIRSASPSPSSPHGSVAAPPTAVSLQAPPNGSFLVVGTYPRVRSKCKHPEQPSLRARYPGSLTVHHAADGTLDISVTLPFERYLDGIAEVPPSWPMAALQAQAIAARSYALASTGWSGAQGEVLRTPICASTSCQVYGGIPVPPQSDTRRWVRAVRRTRGLVLLYGGRPADTVYFSTSNGHTYGNDQVFGSAPLPYLRPVVERDDGASPESHWRVVLPVRNLATFLLEAHLWPKGKAIRRVLRHGSTIVIEGQGTKRSMDESVFTSAVDTWAPCLEPDRYPSTSWKGPPLPLTIPSRWFTVATGRGAVVVTGRGWGHGVGMVQWGAHGKARRGLSATQILAYYYGGLQPRRYPEPGLIHVLVASGLRLLTIAPSGSGAKLDGRALGRGKLRISGGDLRGA